MHSFLGRCAAAIVVIIFCTTAAAECNLVEMERQQILRTQGFGDSIFGQLVDFDGEWLVSSAPTSEWTDGGHILVYRKVSGTFLPWQALQPADVAFAGVGYQICLRDDLLIAAAGNSIPRIAVFRR